MTSLSMDELRETINTLADTNSFAVAGDRMGYTRLTIHYRVNTAIADRLGLTSPLWECGRFTDSGEKALFLINANMGEFIRTTKYPDILGVVIKTIGSMILVAYPQIERKVMIKAEDIINV